MALYHAYNQTVGDGTATSVVRPSDWNSGHNQFVTLSGNTAGQSTISGTNIVYQGGNNVTLSAVTAAGAATIIVSGANTVAQTVQPVAFSASGGSSSFSTLTFSNNGNNVTFINSGGQVALSHSLQPLSNTSAITAAAFPIANTTQFAGTGTTLALTNLTGTIDVGSNGVALSLSGNAAGGGGGTVSYYDLYEFGNNTVLSSYGQNSLHFQLFEPGINITMTGVNILVSGSTSTAAGPSPNILGQTFSYGIYSQGTGASTSLLASMATSSFFLNALQLSTTSASYAIGQGTNSFTASAANSTLLSFLSGIKALQLPFVTSLASSGQYAFVFANSTSLAVSGSNVLRISNVVMTNAAGVSASYGLFYTGGALVSNSSLTQEFQQLVWSATSGAWPATIAYNALSNNGASVNHAFAYFNA